MECRDINYNIADNYAVLADDRVFSGDLWFFKRNTKRSLKFMKKK